jgi:hypothetical protein
VRAQAGAEACLDEAERLEGRSSAVRAARARLRDARRAEKARERQLYSGLIQGGSVHQAAQAAAEKRTARRAAVLRIAHALAAPVTWPGGLLLRLVLRPLYERLVEPAWRLAARLATGGLEAALRRVFGDEGIHMSKEHSE